MADQILTTSFRLFVETFRRMLVDDQAGDMTSETALLVSALFFAAAATAGAGVWLLFGVL